MDSHFSAAIGSSASFSPNAWSATSSRARTQYVLPAHFRVRGQQGCNRGALLCAGHYGNHAGAERWQPHCVRKETAKVYRDGSGRTRRELAVNAIGRWASSAGSPTQMVSISDPVAGAHYMLNVQQKKAFQMPAPPKPPVPPPGLMTSARVYVARGGVTSAGPDMAFVGHRQPLRRVAGYPGDRRGPGPGHAGDANHSRRKDR